MPRGLYRWYINTVEGDGVEQGGRHYMNRDETPVTVRIYARIAPTDDELRVDINDDDVSIMDSYASLGQGENSSDMAEDFVSNALIAEGSWLSLDIDRTGGAKDISVVLETVSLTADEDLEED